MRHEPSLVGLAGHAGLRGALDGRPGRATW